MLRENSRAARECKIHLPNVEPAIFDSYVQWITWRSFLLPTSDTVASQNQRYLELVKLYIFSKDFGVPILLNFVLDMLMSTAKQGTQTLPQIDPVIRLAYKNTVNGSSLRKFLVALLTNRVGFQFWSHEATRAVLVTVPEFAADLAVAMAERAKGKAAQLACLEFDMTPFYQTVGNS